MLLWSCAITFSFVLTIIAAAVLLFLEKSVKPPPTSSSSLWCLYDIDAPFDLNRSGQYCDIIVLCCLVDERSLDAIATLRADLVKFGLSQPLMIMPWRDDWFWRRLCSDMVTREFVQLFVDSLSQLNVIGVIQSHTAECQDDALLLEDRLVALVKEREPFRAEVWMSTGSRQLHHRVVSCRSSHVVVWHQFDSAAQICRVNVTRKLSQARKLRQANTNAVIVHTVPAIWHLIHSCLECKHLNRTFSLNAKRSLCSAYAIRGSNSIYLRFSARALLLMIVRLSGPFLVTDIAEDETAADSVGRPHLTILEQLSKYFNKRKT